MQIQKRQKQNVCAWCNPKAYSSKDELHSGYKTCNNHITMMRQKAQSRKEKAN